MSRSLTGLRAWLVQRVTAVYLGLFGVLALGYFIFSPPASFPEWQGLMAGPLISAAVLIGLLALLLHAWVGMRDILLDYVPHLPLRLLLLSLAGIALAGLGAWGLRILLLAGPIAG